MDKLKPLIKYHFWILSSIVVAAVIGVGVWSWMNVGEVINRQKSDILSAESKAKGVTSVRAEVADAAGPSVHPNEETIEGMKKEIDGGKDEVLAAWEKLYSEQKELLTWPGAVMDSKISEPFDALRPEQLKFDPNSAEGEVALNRRRQIRTVFKDFMPVLVRSVRAKWNAADVTGVAEEQPVVAAGVDAQNDDMEKLMLDEPLVTWSLGDQIKWYGMFTNFKEKNGNQSIDGTPTTIQVVYVKENLILLNGVLEIIKEVNKDATIPSQAAIRDINSIMIGREAHEAKPMELDAAAMSGGAGGFLEEAAGRMNMMQEYMKNMLGGGDQQSATISASDAEKLDPVHLRYIDREFKPIAAAAYRQSVSSNQLGADSWMSVVKRVPVRLRLRVDERRIPEILEKCANARIPLEVRQMTVVGGEMPADTTASAAKGSEPEMEGPEVAGTGGSAQMTVDPGAGRSGEQETAKADSDKEQTFKSPEFNSHFLVPLEIYGVMKFYSAPAPEALGKKTETAPSL
ncbi:MAG: hypothetical protein JNL67_06155 [Planctomycetaceae bacterium]|nr:hypothetical protein [Planctomycetaceae bacterium]